MSLPIFYAPWFDADLQLRTAWYIEQGGNELADRFVTAVEITVRKLAGNPHSGRRPYPNDIELSLLYCVLIEGPFHKYILYYRFTPQMLSLERLIHGARDLPRWLRQPPGA